MDENIQIEETDKPTKTHIKERKAEQIKRGDFHIIIQFLILTLEDFIALKLSII